MRIVVTEEHEAEGTFLKNKNIVFAKKIVLIKNINFDCRPYLCRQMQGQLKKTLKIIPAAVNNPYLNEI